MEGQAQVANGRRRLRLVTRLAALLAAVVLSLPILPWSWTAMLLPAASPYVAAGSALAARAVGAAALVGLPVLLAILIFPRWFCRYACPVGLLEETVSRRRRGATSVGRWPPVGQWVSLLTLGGAVAGYPLVLWLDPLGLLAGFLGVWRWPVSVAGIAVGLGLPIVLILSAVFPHAWCARVCPLGGLQDVLAGLRRLVRKPVAVAAAATPAVVQGADASEPKPAARGLARRSLLCLAAGGALGWAARVSCGQARPPIRPPGAVDEPRFTGLCIRCGNCVRVCPSKIIRSDLGRHGAAGFLTPILCFEDSYCLPDCRECTTVCPSGAIARLPLPQKRACIIGQARVNLDTCILANGQDCTACIRACPYKAIGVLDSADGSSSRPVVDLRLCNGCGACEAACPTSPEKSILVYPPGT